MSDPSLPQQLLHALAAGEPVSGAELARRLGVTRAAVWKRMAALRELGLPISALSGRGYCLPWPLQLLDSAAIDAQLGTHADAPVRVHWALDSTQAELAARAGEWPDQAVLLAEIQRTGRGRRGRGWQAPPACGITMSGLKRFELGFAHLAGLSTVVGVTIIEALAELGIDGLQLKWPNDVLYRGGKLAGVLIDLKGEYEGPCHAVIGLGLNVRLPEGVRQQIGQPVVALEDLLDVVPDRNLIAARLVQHLRAGLQTFERDGFAPFQDKFVRFDGLRDRPVTASVAGGRRLYGTAEGITARGALRLRAEDGVHEITGGEVTVRLPA